MSFLTTLPPSLRELRERRERLADTPDIVAHLRAADPVSTDGKSFYSLANLGTRIEQLWQLVCHYEANTRNHGTPPPEPPKPPKEPARSLRLADRTHPSRSAPMHMTRPTAANAIKAQAKAKAKKPPKPQPVRENFTPASQPRPAGWLTLEQVLELVNLTQSPLYRRIEAGRFPKAGHQHGGFKLWEATAVHAAVAQLTAERAAGRNLRQPMPRRDRPSRANNYSPQPEGTWTSRQICERLQRSQPWIYQMMNRKPEHGAPFPRPCGEWGPLVLWSIKDVQAWVADRAITQNAKSSRKPLGSLDTRRFNADHSNNAAP